MKEGIKRSPGWGKPKEGGKLLTLSRWEKTLLPKQDICTKANPYKTRRDDIQAERIAASKLRERLSFLWARWLKTQTPNKGAKQWGLPEQLKRPLVECKARTGRLKDSQQNDQTADEGHWTKRRGAKAGARR